MEQQQAFAEVPFERYRKPTRRCTAPDLLDTVVAISDPTCGSPRSTIIVPEPMLCAVCSRPPGALSDGRSPSCSHAAADGLRKSRRT